jgi:DNA-binding MarR family transcriptional regulator
MAPTSPSLSTIREVRDTCLCLASQRAARRLARRFDRAFQPAGLTNNQFSALMFIAAAGQTPGRLADLMAMDRTTVTALLKALERGGLIASEPDEDDRRIRRIAITDAGRARLEAALPIWRAEHARLKAALPAEPTGRALLAALADAPLTSSSPAAP